MKAKHLIIIAAWLFLGASFRDTSRLASALVHWGVGVEFNELGGVLEDLEGGDGDFAGVDGDVAVVDDNAGVVDALCKADVVHARLQSGLQKVGGLQVQNVIELLLLVLQQTEARQSPQKRCTLENPLRILGVQLQKNTSGFSNLRQSEINTP